MKKWMMLSCLPLMLCADEECQSCCCLGVDYEIHGELLFLQPNGSNLIFAMQANPKNYALAVPLVEANWFAHEIDPAYHPAFDVGAKVIFRDIEMNLALDWEHLSGTDTKHFSVPNGIEMVGPLFDIGPFAFDYIKAKGKVRFQFDMADLVLEKRIFCQQHWTVDIFAGASFARIKQSMRNQYFSLDNSVGRIIKFPSSFLGGGPLIGFNFSYEFFNHFYFNGSSAIALLMGELKNKTTFESFAPDLTLLDIPQPNTERTHVPNRTQLVPGFDERLGFAYDFCFCNVNFALEAGYLFQIFLDAVQTLDISVLVNQDELPFPRTVGYYADGFQRNLSNFILTGPYVNLSITF